MKKDKASRVPILLSAFGCPGLGQFFQKRWVPGIIFAAGFLVGFAGVAKLAVRNIIELYSFASNFDQAPEPNPVPLSAFVTPLLIAGISYLISLLDVFLAHQRIARRLHEETFMNDHFPVTGNSTEQHGETDSSKTGD